MLLSPRATLLGLRARIKFMCREKIAATRWEVLYIVIARGYISTTYVAMNWKYPRYERMGKE